MSQHFTAGLRPRGRRGPASTGRIATGRLRRDAGDFGDKDAISAREHDATDAQDPNKTGTGTLLWCKLPNAQLPAPVYTNCKAIHACRKGTSK